jgi:hypothetical protein
VIVVMAVAGILLWLGFTLIFDAVGRRRREPLADRMARHRATELADEAQGWLGRESSGG